MGLDALHAEMVACLMGEKMAAELWISKVILETDSMLVKSALETTSFALTATSGIVFEINSFLILYFDSVIVSFCHNKCN